MTRTPGWPDRAAGVLLASAAGDALGAGYEFTHPAPGSTIGMVGGGAFDWAPGEWTDDTAMTLAVARVTATGADLNTTVGLDAVAAGFAEWYASGPKDIGNQTRRVLSARDTTAAGMSETARRIGGLKGGNGSLMRTAAIGLTHLDDAEACAAAAARVGALTHDDRRAMQACQLWSHAIRHAVLHGTFDGVRGYLDRVGADAAGYWGPRLDEAETGVPADFPNNGWVVQALQTAWWAITHADHRGDARHLTAALELAVRAGGDTDTTAAIAGALLGARWGASAVPAAWRRLLHGWPGMDARDLVRLATLTAAGGRDDREGWPSIGRLTYDGWQTHHGPVRHPHDDGVWLAGYDAVFTADQDAVISLCRMGSETLDAEHVEFWLIDQGHPDNPNLDFLLDDAARTIRALRAEGKTVLLHCVEGMSRTPSVAARYSRLLGRNPDDVLTAMTWNRPNPELWAAATTGASVARARALATEAHAGQVDKVGAPYIEHPARIAARVRAAGAGEDAEVVAWLHDVVEDTDVTLEVINREFGSNIADAVDAITRRDGEGDAYYRRVVANPIARVVKEHDIADNTAPDRTALLDPATRARLTAKYAHATELLAIAADPN
jgi:ADP-ribosyl-[dinitrogen reductase] hydrolase